MPDSDAQKKRLALVVEDNPDNLLLTQAVLRRAGYRTAAATSAEEAVRCIGTLSPDFVLMDIQLPGQDGLSLVQDLRRDERGAAIPIIALSAHAMAETKLAAEAAGCDGFMTKPIDTRTFAADLGCILNESPRWTRP